MTDKLPPHEAWDRAVENLLDDEAERVAKLTDEEVDRDLARKGVDPKAIRAKGEALAAKLKAGKAAMAAKVSAPSAVAPAKPIETAKNSSCGLIRLRSESYRPGG